MASRTLTSAALTPAALTLAAFCAVPVQAQQTSTSGPAAAPAGVGASLAAPRRVTGPVPLTLTLKSSRAAPLPLSLGRDNDQNCAFAPTVRVLRVGTREVVFPVPGAEPRLCSQELQAKTLPARGRVAFTRPLDLPAGEYLIEGWFAGLADGARVKIPARPVRVTVRSPRPSGGGVP
ncbi:hypothetical protein [Deinococcus budaensis]|uniref:Uncharacterized protein n=1 Tax=Deinococcus budaensis TaxID=1665626 RepID=A0A7W8LNZ1_9DEIO|nr:hypothetical protein [Deinococcus budaensis]MBB5233092.1 hypothetical protein [Deinococcus budaensis]